MKRAVAAATLALAASACGGDLPATAPTCESFQILAIQAQALPDAQHVPCIHEVPFGWTVTTFEVEEGGASFHLSHAALGNDVVRVHLAEDCVSPSSGERVAIAAGEDQERVTDQGPAMYRAERFEAVEGACIVTEFDFDTEGWEDPFREVSGELATVARDELRQRLLDETDGVLDVDDSSSLSSAASSSRQSER